MTDVIYSTVPGKIAALLSKIKQVGVPAKVTNPWLKTIGFKSSNDGTLIGVLKIAGLIDNSNIPTALWSKFRGSNSKTALGEGIRSGYSDLYAVYPDAHSRSNAELEHVFSSSSKAGKQTIQKAVSTFKNLAAEAEFTNESIEGETHSESNALHAPVANPNAVSKAGKSLATPSLHIDIQVHVSAEASAQQIDQIFASMAKHLYGRN